MLTDDRMKTVNSTTGKSLNETLKEILSESDYNKALPLIDYFETNERITTKNAVKIIGKSYSTARRYLRILEEAKIIKLSGNTNHAAYVKLHSDETA